MKIREGLPPLLYFKNPLNSVKIFYWIPLYFRYVPMIALIFSIECHEIFSIFSSECLDIFHWMPRDIFDVFSGRFALLHEKSASFIKNAHFFNALFWINFHWGAQNGWKSWKTMFYVFCLFTPLFRRFRLSRVWHVQEH